jgi:putative endonuclease
MYKTYILLSEKFNKFYIGSIEDLENRLKLHNGGRVKSTKRYMPWRLVYFESFCSRQEAYKRELQIKSYKGGEAFKELFGN